MLLFAALRGLEKAPRLPGDPGGRGLARLCLRAPLVPARTLSLSGIAIAAALWILLGVAPQADAKPIAQSSPVSEDLGAVETEYSGRADGLSPNARLFTPLSAPVLLQYTQEVTLLGLNPLSPHAIELGAISPLGPQEFHQTPSHPDTLEQILRSIATVHPQGEPRVSPLKVRPQQGDGSQSISNDAQDQGLAEFFLQSETAGAVLRAAVDLKTVDEHGVTFSILGMGNFELNAIAGTHDVMLSELSNGWSATFSGSADPKRVPDATNSPQTGDNGASPRPRPNLFRLVVTWVQDFLVSPIGVLLTFLSGLTLLGWAAISTLRAVRGTPSRHRRFRKIRLTHGEPTSALPRKKRVAVSRHGRSRRRFGKRAPQV